MNYQQVFLLSVHGSIRTCCNRCRAAVVALFVGKWSHLQQGGRCQITWIECITLKWYTFLSVALVSLFFGQNDVCGWAGDASACCAAGNERHACTNCAVRCSSVLFPTLKQSLFLSSHFYSTQSLRFNVTFWLGRVLFVADAYCDEDF